MTPLLLAAAAFAAALVLTGIVRRYAETKLVDEPNERSSHVHPTPRGGGLAIAIAFLGTSGAAWGLGLVPGRVAAALVLGGAVITLLGWMDDHRDLPVRVRFPVQLATAGGAVWLVGGLPALDWGPGRVPLGALGFALAVLGVIWSLNLFNFMDGIDGIAAGEALSLGGFGGALLMLAGADGLAALAFAGAASAAGFLWWNWHPAKIFMGDVGSGLLGYAFAVLALASENAGAVPLLGWVALYAVFVVDATLTLVRRARRGERVHEAHRLHAYQRMAQAGWSHARVSSSVLALNAVLALFALAAMRIPSLLLPALAAALLVAGGAYAAVERARPMYPSRRHGDAAPRPASPGPSRSGPVVR